MELWIPPLISGIFSLVVVALGARFIGRREIRQRIEDQQRADIDHQRQAVVRFLRFQRESAEELRAALIPFRKTYKEGELSPADLSKLNTLWRSYHNGLKGEMNELDLNLYHDDVREKFRKLELLITDYEEARKENVSDVSELMSLPPKERTEAIEKHLLLTPVKIDVKVARQELQDTARSSFRRQFPRHYNGRGMFT